MPDRPCCSTADSASPNAARLLHSLTFCVCFALVWSSATPLSAEVRVVTSEGEFRMGDRDTKEDAMRLAIEAAKRNALEQVATYLESVTIMEGADITKDEIRTYTAGLILVLDQQANLWLDGDRVVVTVNLTSQIDTDDVAQAILALRENESARNQLVTLKSEIDELHKELEAANISLASAFTVEEAQQASIQRQDLLDRVQSNAMVSQAWTDWIIVGPYGYPASWGGLPPQGLLNVARGLYPANPHVDAAEHVIVTQPPAISPQRPAPITRPMLPHGSRPVPLTLNEITHTTSTLPVHLGNQPPGASPGSSTDSRSMRSRAQFFEPPATGSSPGARFMSPGSSSVRSLHQFLEPPTAGPSSGQQLPPSGSGSVRSLQQFLQPPAHANPSAQPPVTRRLPPTMQPHLPSAGIPRGPSHLAPRSFGGHYGTGRGGYGGRGGGTHGGGRGR